MVSKLEKQWPDVKVNVKHNHPRDIDKRLMASPLLHGLTFGINNWKMGHEAHEQFTRLPELRDILLNNPQLRVLDIKTKYSWMTNGRAWPESERKAHIMNMPLQSSDRLPTLFELRFSGPDTYELDLAQCQLWGQCMDWSQLRLLDLGLSCPQHFFEQIGSRLVSLKSLTMGVRTGDRKYTHWKYGPMTCDSQSFEPVTRFLRSVPGLHELRTTELDTAASYVVPAIMESQGSLRTLSYHASMYPRYRQKPFPSVWKTAQLDELRRRTPDLVDLEIDFELEDGKWVGQ